MRRLIAAAALALAAFAMPAMGKPVTGIYPEGSAYLYKNGAFTQIAGPMSLVYSMNDKGIAVGVGGRPFMGDGLIYDTNTNQLTTFDLPAPNLGHGPTALGHFFTWLTNIDDAGDFGGIAYKQNGAYGSQFAFSDIGGVISSGIAPVLFTGGAPGGPSPPAHLPGIPNSFVQPVGIMPDGTAVVNVTLPEPSPLSILMSGLAMLLLVAIGRRKINARPTGS